MVPEIKRSTAKAKHRATKVVHEFLNERLMSMNEHTLQDSLLLIMNWRSKLSQMHWKKQFTRCLHFVTCHVFFIISDNNQDQNRTFFFLVLREKNFTVMSIGDVLERSYCFSITDQNEQYKVSWLGSVSKTSVVKNPLSQIVLAVWLSLISKQHACLLFTSYCIRMQ